MSRQAADMIFLEEWLRSKCGKFNFRNSDPSSATARAIIQAWADIRDSLQHLSFQHHHLQSLKTLVNSQKTLHVADPQAKLVLSILSSPNLSLPSESYPLFFRLLYIWVRKTFKPNSIVIDSAVEVLFHLFSTHFDYRNNALFFSEAILLLGAVSFVPSLAEKPKTICLDFLSGMLKEAYPFLGSFAQLMPDILAGIGYALCSSVTFHHLKILDFSFGIWGKGDGPPGSISHGLMILYLFDWVMSNLLNFQFLDKIHVFSLESFKVNYVPFVVFMAAAGVLRAVNKYASVGMNLDAISKVRNSALVLMESLASDLISRTLGSNISSNDVENRLLLQCVPLALVRTGSFSGHASLFVCVALALVSEIFPLPHLYALALNLSDSSGGLKLNEVKERLDNILFREAGKITAIFCNQYVSDSVDEENKDIVENLVWKYCQDVYLGHRKVALLLKGKDGKLLECLEKIAESAFLMVVVFAFAVTKHKLNTNFTQEMQMEISLKILVTFSCVEYFRHVRLPEYMETIRKVVASVKGNESACTSFVKSMPSYAALTNGPELTTDQKTEYIWSKDEVQTARLLFYLRVIPTCVEHLPSPVFRNLVAPTMFLYIAHPNGKVARASHSLFLAFVSLGKDSDKNDKVSLKEQLVFYYIQRSLLGYPDITPFEGMASGVVGIIRHLPAGSPSIFYCVHSLVETADRLLAEFFVNEVDAGKKWQGEAESCKKLLDLLSRVIFLVDIQVLPDLMKLLAQLITKLPKDAQSMILNDLYSQVAESDDVIRKPTLVSWVQSLYYLCTNATHQIEASRKSKSKYNLSSAL